MNAITRMRSNGGKARSRKLTPAELSDIGRRGGEASRDKLTPAERSERARLAVTARWAAVRAAAKKSKGKKKKAA